MQDWKKQLEWIESLNKGYNASYKALPEPKPAIKPTEQESLIEGTVNDIAALGSGAVAGLRDLGSAATSIYGWATGQDISDYASTLKEYEEASKAAQKKYTKEDSFFGLDGESLFGGARS